MLSALQVDLTAVLVPCAVQLAGACARRPHRQHTCSRLCQTIIPCCLRLQALEARGLIGSVQEMIQGAPTGPKLTMTSRLFLRRFLPRVVVQIEADVEAQQVVEALAACPDQTAVESDMKVATFSLCMWILDKSIHCMWGTATPLVSLMLIIIIPHTG